MTRNRFTAQALLLAPLLTGIPIAAWALSLGALDVTSTLGQPLRAEIPLRHVPAGGLHGVTVHIAPRAAFRAAGVQMPRFATDIRCRITDRHGRPVVLLQSHDPVESPQISFLIALNAPTGSQVQEYTATVKPQLLLMTHRPQATPQALSTVAFPSAPALPPPSRSTPAHRYQHLGRIQPGESLLDAALHMAPWHTNHEVLMMALFRDNPQAFDHHNVNDMRAGARLQTPSRAQVAAIAPALAHHFLIAQHAAWERLQTPPPAQSHPARSVPLPVPPTHISTHLLPAVPQAAAAPVTPSFLADGVLKTSGTLPPSPIAAPPVVAVPSSLPAVRVVQRVPRVTSPAPAPITFSADNTLPLRDWLILFIFAGGIWTLRKTLKGQRATRGTSQGPLLARFLGIRAASPPITGAEPHPAPIAPLIPPSAASSPHQPAPSDTATAPSVSLAPSPTACAPEAPPVPKADPTPPEKVYVHNDRHMSLSTSADGPDLFDVAAIRIKLDLARAYIDIGALDLARDLLEEVHAAGLSRRRALAKEGGTETRLVSPVSQ